MAFSRKSQALNHARNSPYADRALTPLLRKLLLLILLALPSAVRAPAQDEAATPEIDSLRTEPPAAPEDSTWTTFVAVDTARVHDFAAKPLSAGIPARLYAFELKELLIDEAGSFLYDLSSYGWPHGWSPEGTPPQRVRLRWSDIDMADLFTGRPRYEVVPLGLGAVPVLTRGRGGAGHRVEIWTRDYETTPAPLTEFSYQTGRGGLQKVTALHTQNRRLNLGGPGVVNALFWYRGEAADGEYPGSRLRRGRQLHGRLIYLRPRWSVEVSDLYTRQPLQAHGGVIPRIPGNFESIYQRIGAQVVDEGARRTTTRNDLSVAWRRAATSRLSTSARIGVTTETLEYRRPGDTLEVKSRRYFLRGYQTLPVSTHDVGVEVDASFGRSSLQPDSLAPETHDNYVQVAAFDAFVLKGVHVRVDGGALFRKEGAAAAASLSLAAHVGRIGWKLEASRTPQYISVMERTGLGQFVTAASGLGNAHQDMLRGELRLNAGPLDVVASGSVLSDASWHDFFATPNPDSIVSRAGSGSLLLTTWSIDAGLRRKATRGFYIEGGPTLFRVRNANDTEDLRRLTASLPDFYAFARLGARYLLFHGDLDLDASVRGRFWSSFKSRVLHTQTGLLAVSTTGGTSVESSAAVDVVLTAGVRTATLFLVYENFLSGTSAIPGNLLVPVYPLAERRLRFGVFWPISN